MAIPEPEIDTMTFSELVRAARARVPVHTPEWTNLGEADPGITLTQLFAFIGESVIYRANRIPERNRLKFLRLLGIGLRPASASEGLVAFSNPRGPAVALTLERDQELKAGPVKFLTATGLDVLPIESRLYIKRPVPAGSQPEVETLYRQLYASFEAPGQTLAFYQTEAVLPPVPGEAPRATDLAADTIDGTFWLALLARPGEGPAALRPILGGRVLTLGIAPAAAADDRVLQPGAEAPGTGSDAPPLFTYDLPVTTTSDPRYVPVEAQTSGDLAASPGLVQLRLPGAGGLAYDWDDTLDPLEAGAGAYPPSLAETEDQDRLITWVRIRPAGTEAAGGRQTRIALQWMGINAARIVQRSVAPPERLLPGTGEPDQTATLTKTPVLPETLMVAVNGVLWSETDDLAAAPGEGTRDAPPAEAQVYALDPASGTITFGTGLHGARPPAGAVIQAAYAYGGGAEGQVAVGAVSSGPSLPSAVKVTNPIATWGGARGETVEEAERRIPQSYRRRNRLISAVDFREVAFATPGIDLGRVEAVPLMHPDLPDQSSPGVVTVMVVPRQDASLSDAPSPDRLVLDRVCRHLGPRRLVTTELHVRGPSYRDIWVSIGLDVVQDADQGPVLEAARQAVRRFLSPLTGGFGGTGWPLRRAVDVAEIAAAATRVAGVAKTTGQLLAGADGGAASVIAMTGLDLPRLAGLAVQGGAPMPIEALMGATAEPEAETRLLPVPIVPETC